MHDEIFWLKRSIPMSLCRFNFFQTDLADISMGFPQCRSQLDNNWGGGGNLVVLCKFKSLSLIIFLEVDSLYGP